jgi:hypothetical protein
MANNISSYEELRRILFEHIEQLPVSESERKRDILYALATAEGYRSEKRLYVSTAGIHMICSVGACWQRDESIAKFKLEESEWLAYPTYPTSDF